MTNTEQKVIAALKKAYWKEIETVMNYLAHSINLDGIKAEEVKEILTVEVEDEMGHAKRLANRIKELDGMIEGSLQFTAEQETSQPSTDTTDLKSVIQGVIDAEMDAIEHYKTIIDLTDGFDFVTQDLCIQLQADEEKHLRIFKGFLKGIEIDEAASVE